MTDASAPTLAIAIDTASDMAGVALFDDGSVVSELTWLSHRNHSRELLPGLDWLLSRAGRDKSEVGAIYVCLGPGSYAGMRVGISTAKALSMGLDAAIVGVGRLEADAEPYLAIAEDRVFAVQAAGRAELAWAAYTADGAEVIAPRLGPTTTLLESLSAGDVLCGALAGLPDTLVEPAAGKGVKLVEAATNRVEAIGRLGWHRLTAGSVDNADTLVPLYLRAPAIGPQPPRE